MEGISLDFLVMEFLEHYVLELLLVLAVLVYFVPEFLGGFMQVFPHFLVGFVMEYLEGFMVELLLESLC